MKIYFCVPTISSRVTMAESVIDKLGACRSEYIVDPIGNLILNHLAAWAKAFSKTDMWASVVQDDIIFAPDFNDRVEYFLKRMDEEGIKALSLFDTSAAGLKDKSEFLPARSRFGIYSFWHEQGVIMHKSLGEKYKDFILMNHKKILREKYNGHWCHDILLGRFWEKENVDMRYANPSLINHDHEVNSTWTNKHTRAIFSKTFVKKYGKGNGN